MFLLHFLKNCDTDVVFILDTESALRNFLYFAKITLTCSFSIIPKSSFTQFPGYILSIISEWSIICELHLELCGLFHYLVLMFSRPYNLVFWVPIEIFFSAYSMLLSVHTTNILLGQHSITYILVLEPLTVHVTKAARWTICSGNCWLSVSISYSNITGILGLFLTI